MKAKVVDSKTYAIGYEKTVRVNATPEETAELRKALAVVERYKKAAMKAAKAGKDADWTMIGYAVKTDCVLVTIEQGMAG
jgi:hypothetical protein